MRIAFFVQYADINGTYFRWHNLAKALQIQGHVIDVYAGDHNWKSQVREEIRDGVQYYIIPALQTARIFYSPNDPFSAWRRMLKLPGKEYDVYHLFQPFLQAYLPWKWLKRKRKRAVFIYDWDDLWTEGLYTKANSIRESYLMKVTATLEKKIPEVSDAVTVCSDFLGNRLRKDIPVKKIGNGFWPKAIPPKAESRIKWKLSNDIFYLAYIGKTAGELDWIVDALMLVLEQRKNVRLVIVGPPQSQIDQFTNEQKERMIYLGSVNPDEAREIAAATDMGLIPLDDSLFNQSRFPIKFFDFLTVNTPVYMSDVGEVALIGKKIKQVCIGSAKREEWINGLATAIDFVNNIASTEVSIDIINSYSWPSIAVELANFYSQTISNKFKTLNEAG